MLKRLVPQPIKHAIKEWLRKDQFAKAIKQARTMDADELAADRELLQRLVDNWGNHGWSADVPFIEETLRAAAKTDKPILECGSGLTAIVMAATNSGDRVIYSLEHHSEWVRHMRDQLSKHHLENAEIVSAKLRDYGEYSWYDVSALPPAAQDFGLVICDGPPSDTPGGRYGLLPAANEYFATDCVILLDDYTRDDEKQVVERWTSEYDFNACPPIDGTHYVRIEAT